MKINQKHLSYLRSCGLSDQMIEESGIYSTSSNKVKQLFGQKAGSGMIIPYPNDLTETEQQYNIVKLDKPLKNKGKYLSSLNEKHRLYIPPGVEKALNDPCKNITITKGEINALKAVQEKIVAVGIQDELGYKEVIDQLNIEWKNKIVYIAYDSDIIADYKKSNAEWLLAQELVHLGAKVKCIRIPAGSDGKRVKLANYLVKNDYKILKESAIEPCNCPCQAHRHKK